jgi:hypothetical protein
VAWCDVAVDLAQPAPYLPRCRSCLFRLRNFYEQASAEVPERVQTKIILVIEHNAEESAQEVWDAIKRRAFPPAASTWKLVTSTMKNSSADQ